ncbi:unnamed protein product [Hymenolepis diminuta]|uniref:Uncharacterized protein n=1 Tax=Hymenolepis diminuta TaxID=6216 RepID=A0A564YDM8_HYMDI|nr:unnamed protein product [Hymenolepis diminuta]
MLHEATFLEKTIFSSLTPEQPVIPDVVRRRERSHDKDERIIKSTNGRVTQRK